MSFRYINFVLIFFACLVQSVLCQVIIKELPQKNSLSSDSLFSGITATRSIVNLDGNWYTYLPGEKEKKKVISVPSNFKGTDELVFERNLNVSSSQILNNNLQLVFLGINYAAEISVNGYVIYKHPGGAFPFTIDLPKDILKSNGKNLLTVKVAHKLLSDATIPLEQGFLQPENIGGIFRDVYILVTPNISISSMDFSYKMPDQNSAALLIRTKIVNNSNKIDTVTSEEFTLKVKLNGPGNEDIISPQGTSVEVAPRKEKELVFSYSIKNPPLWSPQLPQINKLYLQLFKGDTVNR